MAKLSLIWAAVVNIHPLDIVYSPVTGEFPAQRAIITTWRGITCRIAITFEGVENPYLPGNVHFQYRPLGDIGVAVVAGAIRNASRWLDERITWCPLFGGVLSQVRAQAREDLSTRSWQEGRYTSVAPEQNHTIIIITTWSHNASSFYKLFACIYVFCSRQCPNGDGIYTLLYALYKYSTSITNQPTKSRDLG